jgi:hypothetical protein
MMRAASVNSGTLWRHRGFNLDSITQFANRMASFTVEKSGFFRAFAGYLPRAHGTVPVRGCFEQSPVPIPRSTAGR